MAILNGDVPFETASAQTYPDKMLHVEEAKKLVDAITMDGPKSWIRELSKCVHPSPILHLPSIHLVD